jgi:hypothetical protein
VKKLLFQLDTDPIPSAFDIVTAYDAGAHQVVSYAGIAPDQVQGLVHGCIFTRGGEGLRHTAIWIGGRDIAAGEQVLDVVTKSFFGDFRVSVMLDSNGANTTAATAVAQVTRAVDVREGTVVVAAGTGPVGIRTAGLFAREGARVVVTSPLRDQLERASDLVKARFGAEIETRYLENGDVDGYRAILADARVLFGAGPAGVRLVPETAWQESPTLEAVVDLNLAPPLGIEGVSTGDAGTERAGKRCYGAIGVGHPKMKLHKACIASLFERKDLVLDIEEIYAAARRV